jgi:hypothetical protein
MHFDLRILCLQYNYLHGLPCSCVVVPATFVCRVTFCASERAVTTTSPDRSPTSSVIISFSVLPRYRRLVPVRTSTASHVLDVSEEELQTGVGTDMQDSKTAMSYDLLFPRRRSISPCSHALQTSYSLLQQQQMSSFSLGDHVGCRPLCDGVGGSGAPASDSVLPPSASACHELRVR